MSGARVHPWDEIWVTVAEVRLPPQRGGRSQEGPPHQKRNTGLEDIGNLQVIAQDAVGGAHAARLLNCGWRGQRRVVDSIRQAPSRAGVWSGDTREQRRKKEATALGFSAM